MIGIVIVAHGGLAQEYLAALEHVVGKQPGLTAVAIGAECDRMCKKQEIDTAAKSVDVGDGVVVVTDMFGGTPSNLAVEACNNKNRTVIYGANLPLLVKLAKARRHTLKTAVTKAVDAGHKYLNCVQEVSIGTTKNDFRN